MKNSDYAPDEKERANKKILNDYRQIKKELNEVHEFQKQEILKEADKDIAKIPALEKVEVPYGVQLIEKSKKVKVDVLGNVVENESEKESTESVDEDKSASKNEYIEKQEEIIEDKNDKNITPENTDVKNIYATEDEDDESII